MTEAVVLFEMHGREPNDLVQLVEERHGWVVDLRPFADFRNPDGRGRLSIGSSGVVSAGCRS